MYFYPTSPDLSPPFVSSPNICFSKSLLSRQTVKLHYLDSEYAVLRRLKRLLKALKRQLQKFIQEYPGEERPKKRHTAFKAKVRSKKSLLQECKGAQMGIITTKSRLNAEPASFRRVPKPNQKRDRVQTRKDIAPARSCCKCIFKIYRLSMFESLISSSSKRQTIRIELFRSQRCISIIILAFSQSFLGISLSVNLLFLCFCRLQTIHICPEFDNLSQEIG